MTSQKKLKNDLLMRGIKIISILLTTGIFALCWYGYYDDVLWDPFYAKGDLVVIAVYLILYLIFTEIYDAMQISFTSAGEMAYSQILAIGLSDVIIYLVICLLAKGFPWMGPGLLCFVVQAALAVGWSFFANKVFYVLNRARKTIIIHDNRHDLDKLIERYGMGSNFNIVKVVNVQECLNDLSILDGMEVAFFGGIHSRDRNIILKKCITDHIVSYVIPRVGDVIMSGARRMHMFHLPMLRVERYDPSIEFLIAKRVFDVVISAVSLILFSPIFLLTAAAIKLTDGGPVFYRQTRLTRDGREFKILKFRSMRVDAERDGVARLSSGTQDDRITPVGRIIRKCRIDELPQLWNVFKSDMSIIGPRPERPEIAAQYEEIMPEFRLRLQAKAGLTGYAQVYGKYNSTPYDKLQMDLMYIANPNLFEEMRILLATIKILFMPESTEGIDANATTALYPLEPTDETEDDHYDQIAK